MSEDVPLSSGKSVCQGCGSRQIRLSRHLPSTTSTGRKSLDSKLLWVDDRMHETHGTTNETGTATVSPPQVLKKETKNNMYVCVETPMISFFLMLRSSYFTRFTSSKAKHSRACNSTAFPVKEDYEMSQINKCENKTIQENTKRSTIFSGVSG